MDPQDKQHPAVSNWSSRLARATMGSPQRGLDEDHRWARRKRSSLPAYVYSDWLPSAVNCIIRDISSTGALIQLVLADKKSPSVSVDDLPDILTLVMDHNREITDVSCVVIRRFGDHVGLRFTGTFRSTAKQQRIRR